MEWLQAINTTAIDSGMIMITGLKKANLDYLLPRTPSRNWWALYDQPTNVEYTQSRCEQNARDLASSAGLPDKEKSKFYRAKGICEADGKLKDIITRATGQNKVAYAEKMQLVEKITSGSLANDVITRYTDSISPGIVKFGPAANELGKAVSTGLDYNLEITRLYDQLERSLSNGQIAEIRQLRMYYLYKNPRPAVPSKSLYESLIEFLERLRRGQF